MHSRCAQLPRRITGAMVMKPGLRKFALTAHVTSSVAWLGAVAAFLALAVIGLRSVDDDMVRSLYRPRLRVQRMLVCAFNPGISMRTWRTTVVAHTVSLLSRGARVRALPDTPRAWRLFGVAAGLSHIAARRLAANGVEPLLDAPVFYHDDAGHRLVS